MLRIAFSTLRARKGGMLGALAAVVLAAVLVASCGDPARVQPAGADPRRPSAHAAPRSWCKPTRRSSPRTDAGTSSVLLPEQMRVPASLAGRLARPRALGAAIADRTFPVADRRPDGAGSSPAPRAPAPRHGWSAPR